MRIFCLSDDGGRFGGTKAFMYRKYGKRALDVFFAALLLLLLAVPMAIVALVIRLDSPGSVLFTQKRVGLNEKYFTIYKFRTMRTDAPSDLATRLMPGSGEYITRAGRFLRMTSLDELPQLINILKGDMSFVGFRPCLANEEELDRLRVLSGAYEVRPGITGLSQIRGRDELEPDFKAKLDGIYARHVGFDYDLRILTKTFLYVFYAEGYKEGGDENE